MKRILITTLSLGLIFQSMAAVTGDPKESESDGSAIVAEMILEVFENYKLKDHAACKQLMNELSFDLVKEVNKSVPKSAMVDSLVFANDSDNRWAYFKSVDLGYLRDVEAMLVIKHSASRDILASIHALIENENDLVERSEENGFLTIKFKDLAGADVIDDRFKNPSITNVPSLYQYEISTDGEYIILDMKETVPKKVSHNYIALLESQE